MGYLIGDGSTARPLQQMLIGNGAGGAVPIVKIMAGTGSGAEQVWAKAVSLSDTFPTNGPLGAPWNVFGTSPYLPEVSGGAFRIAGSTTDGTNYAHALHSTPLATDEQMVKATITTTNSTWPSWLILGADSSGNNSVVLNWTGSTLTIYRKISGSDTSVASASESQVVGKTFELRCTKNPSTGIYTYTGYVNGAAKSGLSFVDSSSTIGRGPTRRFVGLGGTRRRAAFTNSWSPNLDNWSAIDL